MNQTPETPQNKGGRPRGSKNRPKWLLDALKQQPKRPRGRPKGSKNKPKTLEAWVEKAVSGETVIQPQPSKKTGQKRQYNSKLTFEQRSMKARKARAAQGRLTAPPLPGKPAKLTRVEYAQVVDKAHAEAKRIMKIMEQNGQTPDDEMAKKAILAAFEMISEPLTARDRLAAIRTVLDFTKTKPATKTDVTVKTAEEFLDEIAEDDD